MRQLRPIRDRSLASALVAIMIFMLLAGACGQPEGADRDGDGVRATDTAEPAPTSDPGERDATSTTTQPQADVIAIDHPRAEPSDVSSADTRALVGGLNGFALDFYHAVVEQEDGNLIYSPYSIAMAFSMVYGGARGNTEAQMTDVLGFLPQESHHPAANALDLHLASLGEDAPETGLEQGEPFHLNVANAVWGQRDYPFEDAFLQILAGYYGAGVQAVDFMSDPEAAREAVNDWVADKTEGRIEDAVPVGAIDAMTRLVLANAIYFKAGWLFPFDETATADGPFTLLDDSQVSVPMMHQRTARVPYAEGDGYQSAVLPYTGESVEMVVILPEAGRFEEIESNLDAGFIDQARAAAEIRDVTLTMPSFDFESDLDLALILPGMGMPDPFGPADFSGIAGLSDLFIDEAIHKATIAVDEKGTEAAAVTVIGMDGSEMTRAEMTIDRPFIFAIVERETGAILFLGRVTNPAA